MGEYAERWRRNWGSFFSQYGSYYNRAAECKDVDDPMERLECAVRVMKDLKSARRGAGGRAATPSRRAK